MLKIDSKIIAFTKRFNTQFISEVEILLKYAYSSLSSPKSFSYISFKIDFENQRTFRSEILRYMDFKIWSRTVVIYNKLISTRFMKFRHFLIAYKLKAFA